MATAGERHPTEGIRMILELAEVSEDGARAIYDAHVYTPTEQFSYRAELELGGGAALERASDPAASEEHEKRLTNLLKSTARAAVRKSDEGLTPWPDRINRWRGPGRG